MLWNLSCVATITKGNSWRQNGILFRDKLSNKTYWSSRWRSGQNRASERLYNTHHVPDDGQEPSSSRNPQSDITSEEHLKIVSRILPLNNIHYNVFTPRQWISDICLPWDNWEHIRPTIITCKDSESCLSGTRKSRVSLGSIGSCSLPIILASHTTFADLIWWASYLSRNLLIRPIITIREKTGTVFRGRSCTRTRGWVLG